MKHQDMKKNDENRGRKRNGENKAAKPTVHDICVVKNIDRSAFLSKKLRGLQIRIAESNRPIHQIQQASGIICYIRERTIPEYQKHFDTPVDTSVLQRLAAYLTEAVAECLSFHFPIPEAAKRLLDDCSNWEEAQAALDKWAIIELDAISTEFIDVENLTENCGACIRFTQHCFPQNHADEYIHCDDEISICWRNIGNQVAITFTEFKTGKKSVCTGQWEIPQQEISDLFNRSLPPELTMVYFDVYESNGLYVLMKTKNLNRLESLYKFPPDR